jgi:SulP family sulfate permease
MDTSGLEALEQLHATLQRRDVALVLADVNEQPLGLMRRSGFAQHLGEDQIVPGLGDVFHTTST